MAEPTLIAVFGAGATQDALIWTLTKADFPTLSATGSNSAESLVVALLLKWKDSLTQAAFDANTDQSLLVTDSFSSLITRGTTGYRQSNINVALHKLDSATGIDPDDY